MSKIYQNISRVVIALFLMLCVYQTYFLKEANYETVVAGQGVVTGKFESDYSCGTKGRYTCYSRYLILDNKDKVEVNLDTFTTLKEGDQAYLTYQQQKERPVYALLMAFIGIIVLLAISVLVLIVTGIFIWWSIMHSSKQTFKEYFWE